MCDVSHALGKCHMAHRSAFFGIPIIRVGEMLGYNPSHSLVNGGFLHQIHHHFSILVCILTVPSSIAWVNRSHFLPVSFKSWISTFCFWMTVLNFEIFASIRFIRFRSCVSVLVFMLSSPYAALNTVQTVCVPTEHSDAILRMDAPLDFIKKNKIQVPTVTRYPDVGFGFFWV